MQPLASALPGGPKAANPGLSPDLSPGLKTAIMPTSPGDAFRSATEALRSGETSKAVMSLQYAAEHGHGFALWKLGRMYADGEGVKRDDIRAFEYFQKFADSHADDNPATPRARFVANAFVALGHYYLEGIPNSAVTPSPDLARRMFGHAASYFGDPEAQFQLASLYLDGNGVMRDAKRAVPWLVLASNKGHYKAQAMLGRILFNGEHGTRQRAAGLMWMTVASDGPGAKEPWIAQLARKLDRAGDQRRAGDGVHSAQALGRRPPRVGASVSRRSASERSDALQTRERYEHRLWNGPGSAIARRRRA